jgi:hypothetical protein
MKRRLMILALACYGAVSSANAQVPHIVGTWKLNIQASELLGPPPQSEVRRYSVTDGGYLVGLAVIIDAEGNPQFLQFAAKSDGEDYPEYSSNTLAAFQARGTPTPMAYSETPVNAHTIEWFDKYEGQVYASGTRQVSEDGRTLTILGEIRNSRGETRRLRFVYDKQ